MSYQVINPLFRHKPLDAQHKFEYFFNNDQGVDDMNRQFPDHTSQESQRNGNEPYTDGIDDQAEFGISTAPQNTDDHDHIIDLDRHHKSDNQQDTGCRSMDGFRDIIQR